MKIKYIFFTWLMLAVFLVEGVDNNSKGIHKKAKAKFSKLSPEMHADAIKTLKKMYAAIQRLDSTLADLEVSILALDKHFAKKYHKKDDKAC